MSLYTIKGSNNRIKAKNSFNNVRNTTLTDDRSQLLTWLSPLDPRLRHRDIQERRVKNVGEWLIQTDEFRSWSILDKQGEGNNSVLFCYGDPGVGKTFISSLVVDRLCDQTRGQNTAVVCFYIDFAARKENTASSMLGSLLKQMVRGMEKIPEEISRAFEQEKMAIGGREPQLVDIVKMLQAITSSQPTFMCIDALDECAGVQRLRLLDSLKQILEKSPGTRIFMTGRPYIRDEIENRLAGRVTSVSVVPVEEDIVEYLRVRLSEDETPEAMDQSLEADILETITGDLSEMFLLVSQNSKAILQDSTKCRRRETLMNMEVGDAYGATIERIKAQDGDRSRLGMAALMWVCLAKRSLEKDELCHALAVELGSKDFNSDNIPSISTLVACCQGLIVVDEEDSTMRSVHFTLDDYISARPDIIVRPDSAMAEICLTYLNSTQVKALSTEPSPNILATPFLKYCSVYWGAHAKVELSDYAKSQAVELYRGYPSHISTGLLLGHLEKMDLKDFGTGPPSSGLICVSFFGIAEVAAALVEMECYDINQRDFRGFTALARAAEKGHEEVVRIILGREEVNPDQPNVRGRTPLSFAAESGAEGAVKLLLGRKEVDPDRLDEEGRTPLSRACQTGYEEVVKMLLAREASPDRPDKTGKTPLSYAAWRGHEGVVKILLGQKQVTPSWPDKYGQTPLKIATRYGHKRVVELLQPHEGATPGPI